MALTRLFLQDLGLEKGVIQQILDEHGETIKSAKQAAKDEAEEPLNKKIKRLEGEKADLEKRAKDAPADGGEDWKKRYDDEVIAHKATKDRHAAEKTAAATAAAIRKHLEADGANPKAIDLLMKAIDPAAVKLKDGVIENWADVSGLMKEQYSDFFGEVKQQGANVGTAMAASGALNPFSKEHFNLQAQTDMFRENPKLARELAASVGLKLLQ